MKFFGYMLAVGLLMLARLLYKPPKDSGDPEFEPAQLSNRGEYVNFVLGTRRTGSLVGHVWGRRSREEGGGSGKGGPSVPGQEIWYENAWHPIAIGPCVTLHAIFVNGEAIWEGPLNSSTAPSGTTVHLPDGEGSFRVYWGEDEQPVDHSLRRSLGVASTWPHLFYVVWEQKRLGNSPTWPQIEYAYTISCPGNTLQNSPYTITEDEGGTNPAHILYQVLTGYFPFGMGLDINAIDGPSMESAGETFASEQLAMNVEHEQGAEGGRLVQAIMQDAGLMMPQVGRRLMCVPQRPPEGDVPVLEDDVIVPPDLRSVVRHGESTTNRPVFMFARRRGSKFSYEQADIGNPNDAESEAGHVSAQRTAMETVTSLPIAARVARRREQEVQVQDSSRVEVLRGGRLLYPGLTFIRDGQRYRVTSARWRDDSASVEIECSVDAYGLQPIDPPEDVEAVPEEAMQAAVDAGFTWFRVPPQITGDDRTTIAVMRTRAHEQIAGARIWVAAGGAFTFVGTQNAPAAGGLIEDALPIGDPVILDGPVFEDENGDAAGLPDLTGDAIAWETGTLLAVIGDEAMFFRSADVMPEPEWNAETAYSVGDAVIPDDEPVTGLRYVCVEAGTSGEQEPDWPMAKGEQIEDGSAKWQARHFRYRLRDVIRARYNTEQQAHDAEDRIFLIRASSLSMFRDSLIRAGIEVCVKTEPFTPRGSVDISSVTAICRTLEHIIDPNLTYRQTSDGDYRSLHTGELRTNPDEE